MGNVISIKEKIANKITADNLNKYSRWLSDTAELYPNRMWEIVSKAFDYYRRDVPKIWQAYLGMLAGNVDDEAVIQFYSTIRSNGVPYRDECEFLKVIWVDQSVPSIEDPTEKAEEFRNLSAKYAADHGEIVWSHIVLWFSILELLYDEDWSCISSAEMEDGNYHFLFGHPSGQGMVHLTFNPNVSVEDYRLLSTTGTAIKEKQ